MVYMLFLAKFVHYAIARALLAQEMAVQLVCLVMETLYFRERNVLMPVMTDFQIT
jgi:hypothetical protein